MNATPTQDKPVLRTLRHTMAFAAVAALAACGGGGGGSSPPPPSPVGVNSGQFAQQCSPTNPYRQDSDAGTNPTVGTLDIEKRWAREYVNEAYLWYSQVPTVDANALAYSNANEHYASLDGYFNAITTTPNDRFSFTYPTKAWDDLSQGGLTFGYGIEFSRGSSTPPRNYRVAFVEPGSVAANAGLRRGDTLVSVDGVSIDDNTSAGVAALNAGISPSTAGAHRFVVSRNGATMPAMDLNAGSVALTPVPVTRVHTVGSSRVGYMLFNDHVLPAEGQLINAVNEFRNQSVTDLVVDMRYNGGGYVFLASQLAYMIAGDVQTLNKRFEQYQYNDKRSAETNSLNSLVGFFNTSCFFDNNFRCTRTEPLPTLNLQRVWVLAGRGTCSASEAMINGLRGIDVDVRIIGGTTCGKPYGFVAKDNCGVSYFPIEFQGVNHKGEGNYANGFSATCPAADDLSHELGDVNEGMLAAALFNRANGNACSTAFAKAKALSPDGELLRGPERSNRFGLPVSASVR